MPPVFSAKSEKADESTLSDISPLSSGMDSGQQSPVSPENRKNQKGIRKLWGKYVRHPLSSDSIILLTFVQKYIVLCWENNHLHGVVMQLDIKQSYFYQFKVSHFPVIACPQVYLFLSKQLPKLTVFIH